MKWILALFLLLFSVISSQAQTDSLFIKLKSGQTESIPVVSINRIEFENILSATELSHSGNLLDVGGNYPNPFQSGTAIEFETSEPGNVNVEIIKTTGTIIKRLDCTDCPAGKNILYWDCIDERGNRVETGLYFYEVSFRNEVRMKKMLMIR